MRLLAFLALLSLLGIRMGACCSALPSTPEGKIAIASESAVIVWDGDLHTEHFIRSADFRTNETNIGFLVPTPTQPSLSPASDTALSWLEDTIRPKVIVHDIPVYVPTPYLLEHFLGGTAGSHLGDGLQTVTVLTTAHVGDYDAAVLRADDAGALSRWLNIHGYVSRPAVQEWLQPYVQKKWIITAFKVDRSDPDTHALTLNPVCMSFHTDRPFYPYSEPADTRIKTENAPKRLLRVFLLSNQRMEGSLDGNATRWPGKTVWANAWNPPVASDYADMPSFQAALGVPRTALNACRWMTVFEDRSSPRPGIADLVFAPSSTQERITSRPETRYEVKYVHFSLELLLLGFWMVYWIIRKRREILSRPVDRSVTLHP